MRSLKDRQHQDALAEADDRDLVSRSDKRKQRVETEESLKSLALSLVALKPKNLRRIEVPEYVMESIVKAQGFPSAKARNRQVLVVRQHLRELDAEALQKEVTSILFPPIRKSAKPEAVNAPLEQVEGPDPGDAPQDKPSRVANWERRLLDEGDAALASLVEQYPHADRKSLRQQLRTAVKANTGTSPELQKQYKQSVAKLRQSLNSLVR